MQIVLFELWGKSMVNTFSMLVAPLAFPLLSKTVYKPCSKHQSGGHGTAFCLVYLRITFCLPPLSPQERSALLLQQEVCVFSQYSSKLLCDSQSHHSQLWNSVKCCIVNGVFQSNIYISLEVLSKPKPARVQQTTFYRNWKLDVSVCVIWF